MKLRARVVAKIALPLATAFFCGANESTPPLAEPNSCTQIRIGQDRFVASEDVYSNLSYSDYESEYLVSVAPDGSVTVAKKNGSDRPRKITFPKSVITASVFRGRLLTAVEPGGEMYLMDLKKMNKVIKAGAQGTVRGGGISRDASKTVIVSGDKGEIRYLDFDRNVDKNLIFPELSIKDPGATNPQNSMRQQIAAHFSNDGKTVLFHREGEPFYELKSDQLSKSRPTLRKVPIDDKYKNAWISSEFSLDGQYLQLGSQSMGSSLAGLSSNQRNTYTLFDRTTYKPVLDIESSKSISVPYAATEATVVYFEDKDQKWKLWTKAAGSSEIPVKDPEKITNLTLSPKGDYAVGGFFSESSRSAGQEIYNLRTGKITTAKIFPNTEIYSHLSLMYGGSGKATFATYSLAPRLRNGALDYNKSKRYMVNLETGETLGPFQEPKNGYILLSKDDHPYFTIRDATANHQSSLKYSIDFICVDESRIQIRPNLDCVDCRSAPPDAGAPAAVGISKELGQALSGTDLETLCRAPFQKDDWEKVTPSSTQKKLTTTQASLYLKRFQKPGGFDASIHTPLLLAILKSSLAKSQRGDVQAVLQNVAANSQPLLHYILSSEAGLVTESFSDTASASCRTPQETRDLIESAQKFIEIGLLTKGNKTTMADWAELSVLSPLLSQLSDAKKDEQVDLIAQSLADSAADSQKYSGIFLSKLYKFAFQAVAPFYGIKQKPLTDLTLTRNANSFTPFVLSTHTIEINGRAADADKTYGFPIVLLPAIAIPIEGANAKANQVIYDKTTSWRTNGETYNAKIKMNLLEVDKPIVPSEPAPRYGELWADQNLEGLIVTGSNMGGLSGEVAREYRAYYTDQGFEFPDPPAPRSIDLREYIERAVSNGELDYLIKEAHSDGDEKNLFRIQSKGLIETGVRTFVDPTTKKKRTETIAIVFPDPENLTKTELIKNSEFGDWIKTREKNPGNKRGQFVYFNTSCWSKTKAVHEIESAGTPTLLNIPTLTSTKIFQNHIKNAEYLLLTAFREGKDYAKIREELSKNEEYQTRQGNVFLFPDENSYKENITNLVRFPIKLDMKIQDSKGKDYNIDQVP